MKKLFAALFCIVLGLSCAYGKVYKIHDKGMVWATTFVPNDKINEFASGFKNPMPLSGGDSTTHYNIFLSIANRGCSKNRIFVRGEEQTVCKNTVCQIPFVIILMTAPANVKEIGMRTIFYAIRAGAPSGSSYSKNDKLNEFPKENMCHYSENSVITSSVETYDKKSDISKIMGDGVVVSRVKTESDIVFDKPEEPPVKLVCNFVITSYAEEETNITQECKVNNGAEILESAVLDGDIWTQTAGA